jgi:hypothetical protein
MLIFILSPNKRSVLMQSGYDSNESIDYVKKQPVWAFCLLSFLSFGLYTLYWFYKNWCFFKDLYEWDIYPIWRAIFDIFFVHTLLEQINDRAIAKGHSGISSNLWATGYVITSIVARILDRTLPPSIAVLAVLLPPFLFLIPSVRQVNYLYGKARPNEHQPVFSSGEFVVLALGGTMMGFAILRALSVI